MVLSEKIVAAVLAMFLRNFLKRLPFRTVVQDPVLENSSFGCGMNPQLISAGAGASTICSIFYYLTRHRHKEWARKLRNLSLLKFRKHTHEENHLIAENGLEKAKTRVHNNFQGSQKLQRNAMLYMASQSTDDKRVNKTQKTSRFVPVNTQHKILKPIQEGEEPGTSVAGTSSVQFTTNISAKQELPSCSYKMSKKQSSKINGEENQSKHLLTLKPSFRPLKIDDISLQPAATKNKHLGTNLSFLGSSCGLNLCVNHRIQQQSNKVDLLQKTRSGKVYGIGHILPK